jgi:hypothetical protein
MKLKNYIVAYFVMLPVVIVWPFGLLHLTGVKSYGLLARCKLKARFCCLITTADDM